MATTEALPSGTTPAPTTPPTAPPNGSAPPVTKLVGEIIEDAQKLLNQQAEMFKAEVREDFRRSKRAAEFGSVGIVCATVGAMGLITALAYFLHEQYQFNMWASWGIVGGIFLIVGIALGVTSYILLERFNPLPDKTFNALKENITWKTA
jgi:Putative Actinobacterial Holin-X, holin superfamily III